jgi:hypothetical protein
MNKDINQFTIEVSSDLDYETMVVNLNFCNNQVATLNCDEGIKQVKIEILDRYEDKVIWTFDYQAFINALNIAYEKLKQANVND